MGGDAPATAPRAATRRAGAEPCATPSSLAAVAAARRLGRPLLLHAAPEDYARRKRLARRLHGLLAAEGLRSEAVVLSLVIVVAEEPALRAAVPDLPPPEEGGAPVWLVDTTRADGGAAAVQPLDAELLVVDRFLADLEARLLAADALERRVARELAGLEASGRAAEVRTALADLGAGAFVRRQAASAALAELRPFVLAGLTRAALDAADAEAQERAAALLRERPEGERVPPIGTEWGSFTPACGQNDPYAERELMVACGMGAPGAARPFLRLLAGRPQPR